MVESESNDTTLMGIKSFLQLSDVENKSVVLLGHVKNVANVEPKQINFHYLLRWCHSIALSIKCHSKQFYCKCLYF